jgi:hypothetical protein
MNGRPVLDEESFTKLLAAAYVMQEHQDRVRGNVPAPPADFTQIVSRIVETQHMIQTRGLEAREALDLIAAQMQKLTGAAGIAVGLLQKNELHYKAATGTASLLAGSSIPRDISISAPCLKTGEKLCSPVAQADSRIDQAFRRRLGAQSFVAVPIFHQGKIGGALEIYFSEVGAFSEVDVRACELMAGLATEVMAQAAEQELKQELAAERATVLLALEKLKPQLQKLAGEPELASAPAEIKSNSRTNGSSSHTETELCRVCGHPLAGGEALCRVCGASRGSAKYPGAELQSKWASLLDPQLMNVGQQTEDAISRMEHDNSSHEPETYTLESSLTSIVDEPSNVEESAERLDPGVAQAEEEAATEASEMEIVEGSPWRSAARAKNWLRSQARDKDWNERWKDLRSLHIGDVSLGLSAVVLVVVLTWGFWPRPKIDSASASQGPGAAQGATARRRPKPKPPQLTLFERALVSLGLAEPPPAPQYMGNPQTQVWVDLQTALYYCPGADLYGSTPKGKYTTQEDAQQDQFEPAYRKPCD